jgi:pyruvate kinase
VLSAWKGIETMVEGTKKVKIVATVGPASRSEQVVRKLIEAGADVFRLNFSHGTHEDHRASAGMIRAAARRAGKHVAILADLQGPKIRTGKTEGDRSVVLEKGRKVSLVVGEGLSDEKTIRISYPHLTEDVTAGQRILLNDGAVTLRVRQVRRDTRAVHCIVENTGEYSSHKGVNFPEATLRVPALTPKDRRDLAFALKLEINYVALSFVRRAEDLAPVSRAVKRSGRAVRVIAKIEKPEARDTLPAILDACDGIMVARGDLGVETSPYRVPMLQKDFVGMANKQGKQVIVATQMLESMIGRPLPTRAESTDVANAILDGTDAVMLSGETAVGAYPLEAVRTMARIADATENSRYFNREFVNLSVRSRYAPHAICEAAEWASRDMGGVPILVFSWSGETALYLSKVRSQARVYAFTPSPAVADGLAMAWNMTPFVIPAARDVVAMITTGEQELRRLRHVKKGDTIVVISGATPVSGATNVLRIKQVGEQ